MKKTIAKIMAAAMVLSAVPAVAVPTLTAEAAPADSILLADAEYTDLAGDGYTGISVKTVTPSTANVAENLVFKTSIPKVADKTYSGVSASATLKDKKVYISVTGDGATIRKMITNGDNQVELSAYDKAGTTTFGKKTIGSSEIVLDTYNFGEGVQNSSKQYTEVYDTTGLLATGDIYATLNSSSGEATILRGAASDLDGNDELRGNTLNLDTVIIGGAEYEVREFGTQVLKKAHMKKLVAKNVRRISKGAVRNAKQVKIVNLGDNKKLRKINTKAFYSCKNLKTLKLDGRKLNTVGSNALNGTKKGLVIKIKGNKSQRTKAIKLLKKGKGSNVKYTSL